MSWFKKINQLFTHKELRDDYEEQDQQSQIENEQLPVEEAPAAEPKKPTLHVTETPKEVVEQQQKETKGGAFRFPLIPDDEEDDVFEAPVPQPEKREERAQQQKEKLQDPLNVVLEPEPNAPGIRELLAQRKRGHRQRTQLFAQPQVEQLDVRTEQQTAVPPLQTSPVEPPFVEPKRFVPSSVPSPVFGYGERTDLTKKPDAKEPSTINELLDKHRHEMTTSARQDTTAEVAFTKPQIDVMNKSILQTVESAYEELSPMRHERATETVEEEASLAQPDILEQDVIQMPALPQLTAHKEQQEADLPVEQALSTEEQLCTPLRETNETADQQASLDEMPQHEETAEEQQAVKAPQMLTFEQPAQVASIEEATIVQHEQQMPPVHEETVTTDVQQVEDETPQPLEAEEPTASAIEQVTDEMDVLQQQSVSNDEQAALNMTTAHEAQRSDASVMTLTEEAVHIETTETIHVQQAQVEELVIQNVQVAEQKTPSVVEERKERARPFNVVMLKSDKKKLEEKQRLQAIALEQQAKGIMPTFIEKAPLQQTNFTQQARVEEVPFQGEVIDEERLDEAASAPLHDGTTEQQAIEAPPVVAQVDEVKQHRAQQSHEAVGQAPFQPQVEVDEDVEEAHIVEPNPVRPYTKPSDAFLVPPEENLQDTEWMNEQGERLVDALSHFQVKAQIESIVQGPAVTQFEITVEQGTKVSKVRNLSDDLKLALAARDIRIQAPIPGKNTIGIEIPNRLSRAVRLSEVTASEAFTASSSPLEAALGLDLTGAPVTIDLRKMPHGLIAGATGSGKSVCINSILVSLLYKAAPHELKLLLIDPKMVELAPFNDIPHLVSPVITDVKAATAALKWAVDEMERRYQLFAHVGVRDLERYNKLADKKEQPGHKLPYMLIVIDELADLMMMAPHEVEEAICRIAQKARACGIHLIVATQRPSVDVITGLIKSNIPTRIAFMVSSQIDSRTILDSVGAERLLGRGDMLYLGNGQSAAVRLQGTFVTDDEIEDIIEHVRAQGEPEYIFKQEELLKKTELVEKTDELFEEVCRFVYERKSASTSAIQRHYSIGYSRAARLVDMLEAHGFVSEAKTGNKPRDVYITQEELENMFQ